MAGDTAIYGVAVLTFGAQRVVDADATGSEATLLFDAGRGHACEASSARSVAGGADPLIAGLNTGAIKSIVAVQIDRTRFAKRQRCARGAARCKGGEYVATAQHTIAAQGFSPEFLLACFARGDRDADGKTQSFWCDGRERRAVGANC